MQTLTRLTISDHGLEFIGSFEGFRADLYNDPGNHATIGYGHLVHLGPINGSEPAEFKRPLSKEQALDLLRQDAAHAELTVRLTAMVSMTQSQFDALVSFVFNVGGGNFRDSTLLRKVNASDFAGAAAEFGKWTKGGGKALPGLVRRRAAEALMFAGGVVPAIDHGMSVFLSSLRRGASNQDVRTFQNALRAKGFAALNPHGATGFYGDETVAMCREAFARSGLFAADPAVPDGRLVGWLGLQVL